MNRSILQQVLVYDTCAMYRIVHNYQNSFGYLNE